ncbi:hypothetical protein [Chitinophaga sp. MM2321]|uniref:hypothetical protein n=1 Tax=Chitinophaga sp. MM2321 TaxID=3137178 RepID=UPI0032D57794
MAKSTNSHKILLGKGNELEEEGSFDEAEKLYLEAIDKQPLEAGAYNRLMIIYRKQKAPDAE